VHDRFKGFERRHLLTKRGDLLPQADRFGLCQLALLAVSRLHRGHVALDAGLDLVHPLFQLGLGEVLVPGVHRLELAAVDRRHGVAEQVQLPAQIDEPATGGPDRRAVVLPEVGDGLEVRRQPSGQPHQLDVALASRSSRRLEAIWLM